MTDSDKNEVVVPETIDSNGGTGEAHNATLAEKKLPKVGVKIIVKQPKVEREVVEKKPLTEGQKKAIEKMNLARKAKQAEKIADQKKRDDVEKSSREEAVKKAEEDAKKIADTVIVQKVRGRKAGTKNAIKPVQHEEVKPSKPEEPPRQITHREYVMSALRQRGHQIADDVSPYHLKMLLSRFR